MRLIDADALKREWHMGEKCEECEQDARQCQYDDSFTRMDICSMLDDAPTVGGWVSVKDRLPEENVAVNIVYVNTDPENYCEHIKDKPFTATGVYFRGEWYWWSSVVQDYLAEYGVGYTDKMDKAIIVTHWMPLPEPPKEVSGDA